MTAIPEEDDEFLALEELAFDADEICMPLAHVNWNGEAVCFNWAEFGDAEAEEAEDVGLPCYFILPAGEQMPEASVTIGV
jgi:hypothetical protein